MKSVARMTVAGVGVLAVAAGWWTLTASAETPEDPVTVAETGAVATDTVTRRTLEHTEEFDGSLGYGDQFSLPGFANGTLSDAPDKGAVLRPGDMLYKVDEKPTYWTEGAVPMYRELSSGSEGVDVEQLQRFLQKGGYLDADVEIDGKFGGATRTAVKAWQDDHDLKKTGRIDGVQLLFLPYESIRVAAVPRVGEMVSGGVLEVTEPDLFVTVDVSARKKRAFEGQPVIEVETADGSRFSAEVESISAQQSQDAFGGQNYRVRLQIGVDSDQEPGDASIEAIDVLAENALTVPARALVALIEGGLIACGHVAGPLAQANERFSQARCALGEPLYLDVVAALRQAETKGLMKDTHSIQVIGGRYGLGSKEFTPAMVKSVFDELSKPAPKQVFTVGINDDVTGLSLDFDPEFEVVPEGMKQAVFFGLGSDGTVGANKNSIKIIGEGTDNYAQGYFVYDSKKAGAMTVSHLRFGPTPIRSTYLIRQAEFVACHRFDLLHQIGVLDYAKPGGIFLLNSPGDPNEAWDRLPREIQEQIVMKKIAMIDFMKVVVVRNC